jgi:hypothetical protein
MKITEAKKREKIYALFVHFHGKRKFGSGKKRKNLFFSLSDQTDQNTCETDFLLLFEAKLAHPTSECSRNSDRL